MIRTFRDRLALPPALRRPLLGLAPAAVLALLVAEAGEAGDLPVAAVLVVSGALCAAALAAPRPYFPRVLAAALTVSFAVSAAMTQAVHRPATTPGMTEMCVLLLLVTRSVRQLPLLGAAFAAFAAALDAGMLLLRLRESEWSAAGTFLAPLILAAAILALVLGLYLRLLDTVRERQMLADRQDQRLEYARELHDFVAHHVTAIVAQTKAVRFATASGNAPAPADLDAMLARIEGAGSEAMDSMRSMVSVLRTPDAGADTRPGGTLGRLRPLVAEFSRGGPAAELTLDPRLEDRALPPEITTTAHRVVQEALTNVRKHGAGVGRVDVDVRLCPGERDRMEITVTDDGRAAERDARTGWGESRTGQAESRRGRAESRTGQAESRTGSAESRTESPKGREGFGLLGLTERVEAVGGTLGAGPSEASGWQVTARLPLREAQATDPAA
ncbi:histidine kinase [Streptomyces sp. ODS28]|uniref:sensor histidine kinase n=1 Tax=Streptomyces sp. ODS28 TaxID=3136688 RepID=UPI0031E59D41